MANHFLPRQRKPEIEHEFARSPSLGYEATDDVGLIRCLAHGFPTPLARWHHHDEYELHLIVSTSGKAFVGDWIGTFEPGHLVLVGPHLPHNWVSTDMPEAGVALRDLVIQFPLGLLEAAAQQLPALAELTPLLERSRHGIEFFGLGDLAERQWHTIKNSRGLARLTAFIAMLGEMACCTDYRLLSSVQMRGEGDDRQFDQINAIVHRIMSDFAQPLSAADFAADLGMSESRFSRSFRRATGNTFTDFVNRIRVQQACHLLITTDRLVTHICYEVGFNNVANFNRRFLEIKGMTPTQFRRQAFGRFGGAPTLIAA